MARVGERDRKRQQVVDFINVNPWSKRTAKITNAIIQTGLILEKLKLRANLLQPFPLFRKIFLCGLFVFMITRLSSASRGLSVGLRDSIK